MKYILLGLFLVGCTQTKRINYNTNIPPGIYKFSDGDRVTCYILNESLSCIRN